MSPIFLWWISGYTFHRPICVHCVFLASIFIFTLPMKLCWKKVEGCKTKTQQHFRAGGDCLEVINPPPHRSLNQRLWPREPISNNALLGLRTVLQTLPTFLCYILVLLSCVTFSVTLLCVCKVCSMYGAVAQWVGVGGVWRGEWQLVGDWYDRHRHLPLWGNDCDVADAGTLGL